MSSSSSSSSSIRLGSQQNGISGKDKAKLLKAMREKQKNEEIHRQQNTTANTKSIKHTEMMMARDESKPVQRITLNANKGNDANDRFNPIVNMNKKEEKVVTYFSNYGDDDDDNDNDNDNSNNDTNNHNANSQLPNDFFDEPSAITLSSSTTTVVSSSSSSSTATATATTNDLPEGFFDEPYNNSSNKNNKPSSSNNQNQIIASSSISNTNTISNTTTISNNEDLLFLTKLEQDVQKSNEEAQDDIENDDEFEETIQLAYKTKMAALLMRVNNNNDSNNKDNNNEDINRNEILDVVREASDFVNNMIKASSNTIDDNKDNEIVTTVLLNKRHEKRKRKHNNDDIISFDYNDNWNSQSLFM